MKRIIQRAAALVVGLGLGAIALAGLESVTHISDLNTSWPLGSDLASTSDDHIRNIKVALKTDFPSITGPVTVTQAQINAVAGLSSNLTWTGKHTFSGGSGGGTNAGLIVSTAANPAFTINESGNAVDTKLWDFNSISGTLTFRSINDSLTTAKNWLAVARSANVVSSLTFGNGTDNPTYSFSGTGAISGVGSGLTSLNGTNISSGTVADARLSANIPLLNAANTFSANFASTATGSAPSSATTQVSIRGGSSATFTQVNSTGASNAKIWDSYADGGNQLHLRAVNDAYSVGTDWLTVTRSGGTPTVIQGYGPTAAGAVDMTPDTGTFTATMTGGTTSPTCTARWTRVGNLVMLELCSATATSNATTFTYTGLPAVVQPTVGQNVAMAIALDNGAAVPLITAQLAAASGTITFFKSASSTGWTNVGSKGLNVVNTISYLLN